MNQDMFNNFVQLMDTEESSDSSEDSIFDDSSEDEDATHVKVVNFFDTIEQYSEMDFKSHFRLNKSTVLDLIGKHTSNIGNSQSVCKASALSKHTFFYCDETFMSLSFLANIWN